MTTKTTKTTHLEDYHHLPLQYDFQVGNPVESGFKWILIVGRIIGVSPLSVSLKPKGGKVTFRWRSFSTFHSLFLGFIGLVVLLPQLYSCVELIGTYPTILAEMLGLQGPTVQLSVVSVTIYVLRTSPRLISLFHRWSATMSQLNLTSKDTQFPRFCLKITFLVLGMGFTENILYDLFAIQKEASSLEGNSLIEKLYKTGCRSFANYFPHYSSFISIIFILGNKFGTYSWNFGDIFLIVWCRALSYKFKEMNEELHSTLTAELSENDCHNFNKHKSNSTLEVVVKQKVAPEQQKHNNNPFQIYFLEPDSLTDRCQRKELVWKEIREKILALCSLAEEVTAFVAPLVLACYGYNLFFIILNSLRFLYDSKYDNSAYVYVSTVQFALRVILVTYHASQVYHSTEEIFKSMERFPEHLFSSTAYRLERMLARHPVGVKIFGAMLITRKFFISILSFLFTTEIVLLQAMSAANANKKGQEMSDMMMTIQKMGNANSTNVDGAM